MKRSLGIARCGLACCLCSENDHCSGCADCAAHADCENLRCSLAHGYAHCYECPDAEECRKGLLVKVKPRGFTLFARRYGTERLMDRLERDERRGVVYHRVGVEGDYDDFPSAEALVAALCADDGHAD